MATKSGLTQFLGSAMAGSCLAGGGADEVAFEYEKMLELELLDGGGTQAWEAAQVKYACDLPPFIFSCMGRMTISLYAAI